MLFDEQIPPPTTTTKGTKYTLTNADNYLSSLNCNISDLLTQQLNLANEYTKRMNEIYININNKNHFYIFIKGLESIYHIFYSLIYYTKNIHIAREHCQKSIYFYIEFVNQIMDVSNTFLKLTISDAVLFIYKKTIFDINKSLCKNLNNSPSNKEQNTYNTIIIHGNIIKMVVSYIYYYGNPKLIQSQSQQHSHLFENILNVYDLISETLKSIVAYDISYINYCNLYCLTELLYEYFNEIYTPEQYLECLGKFCKNIKNIDTSPKQMRENIYLKPILLLKPTQLIKLFE